MRAAASLPSMQARRGLLRLAAFSFMA